MRSRTPSRLPLLALSLLTWTLALTLLDAKSLWLDEANGLVVTRLGLAALAAAQNELYHPPLFYWLLAQWLPLGRGEFFWRFPSVLFSVLNVLLAWQLARAWFGRAVALTAAPLVALSPVLLWYAQELRPYALLVTLSLLTTLSVTHLCLHTAPHPSQRPLQHPPSRRSLYTAFAWWLLAAVSITAAIYLHYFALLLLGLHLVTGLALLSARRSAPWSLFLVLSAWVVALIAYWPWVQTPVFAAFLRLPTDSGNYIAALLVQRFGVPEALIHRTTLWLAFGVVGGLLSLALLYVILHTLHARGLWARLQGARWLPLAAAALFAALLVFFVVPRAYTVKRQLLLLVPYLLIAFAWWWPWPRRRHLVVAIAVLSLLASLANILLVPKNEWRAAAAHIAAHAEPGDLVLLTPAYMTIPYDLYAPAHPPREGVPFELDPAALAPLTGAHDRIWLVYDPFDNDPNRRLLRWLEAHATLVESIPFFRLNVELYSLAGP
jgi:uncharacterized membrane protein